MGQVNFDGEDVIQKELKHRTYITRSDLGFYIFTIWKCLGRSEGGLPEQQALVV